VDDEMIYDSLSAELDDFSTFVAHIMRFIEDTAEKRD